MNVSSLNWTVCLREKSNSSLNLKVFALASARPYRVRSFSVRQEALAARSLPRGDMPTWNHEQINTRPGLGDFPGQFDWDWFTTFTFRQAYPIARRPSKIQQLHRNP
jgi:hypothetical protein